MLILTLVVVALSVIGPGVAQALYSCEMAEYLGAVGAKPGYYFMAALCVYEVYLVGEGSFKDY